MRLVLASSSMTRRKIMDILNIEYDVITSDIEENSTEKSPDKYVEELSRNKAEAVSKKLEGNYIIIAADTIIYKNGKKYEKPKSKEEATLNLKELSGGKNQAYTGVCIIDKKNEKMCNFSCATDVYFKDISDEDIMWYVNHKEDLLYNAGYSLDSVMSLFLEKLDGDFYNVLGLPLGKIYTKLNEMGYTLKDLD